MIGSMLRQYFVGTNVKTLKPMNKCKADKNLWDEMKQTLKPINDFDSMIIG